MSLCIGGAEMGLREGWEASRSCCQGSQGLRAPLDPGQVVGYSGHCSGVPLPIFEGIPSKLSWDPPQWTALEISLELAQCSIRASRCNTIMCQWVCGLRGWQAPQYQPGGDNQTPGSRAWEMKGPHLIKSASLTHLPPAHPCLWLRIR